MEVFEEGPVPRLIWHLGANSRVPGRLPPRQGKGGSFSWIPPGQLSSPENRRGDACVCDIVTRAAGMGREQAWILLNPTELQSRSTVCACCGDGVGGEKEGVDSEMSKTQ